MTDYTQSNYAPWYDYRSSITKVELIDGIVHVGAYAFYDCGKLQSVTIPSSIASIGDSAFWKSENIQNVYISDLAAWCKIDFMSPASNPFHHYFNDEKLYLNGKLITELVIPTGVTSIGDYAFRSFESAVSVTIPNSVTKIGRDAFSDCDYIHSVTIPNSVTYIGDDAFRSCDKLKNVYISDLAAWCRITFEGQYSNPGSDYLYLNHKLLTDLRIPDGITTLKQYAFAGFDSITNVSFPDSVTEIGEAAFYYCKGITNVSFPKSLKVVGSSAFTGCEGLTNVTIPDSVTSIGSCAFMNCKTLTGVTLPTTIENIESYTFHLCRSLTNVTIPDRVTAIGRSAFSECDSLVNVTVPGSVRIIDMDAFYGCDNLEKLIILNTNCSIYNHKTTLGLVNKTVIYGYPSSTAKEYAKIYGYAFSPLSALSEAPSEEMLHCIFADMSYAYIPTSFEGKLVAQWLVAAPWKKDSSYTETMEQKIYNSSNINRIDIYGLLGDWTIESVETGEAGYAAVVFRKGDRTVIAYRGSEDGILSIFKGEDWSVDAQFALFNYLNPKQFQAALDTYHKFKDNGYVTLTGHSLGGALTAYVSILEKVKGYAFDGACGHVVDLAYAYNPLDIEYTGVEDMLFTNYTDPKQLDIMGADYIQHSHANMFPGVCYQTNEDCVRYYGSIYWTHQIYSNTRLTASGKGIEFMPVAETHSTDTPRWAQFHHGDESQIRQYVLFDRRIPSEWQVSLGTKKDDTLPYLFSGNHSNIHIAYGGDGCDTINGSYDANILIPNELSGDILSGGIGNDCYILECHLGGTVYISDHSGVDRIILTHTGDLTKITVKYLGLAADKKWQAYSINGNILVYLKVTKSWFAHTVTVIDENGESLGTISTKGEYKPNTRNTASEKVPFKAVYIDGDTTLHVYDESNNFVADFSARNPGLYLEDYGTIEVGENEDIPFISASLPSIYHIRVSGEGSANIAVIGNNTEGYVDKITRAEEVKLSAGKAEIQMEEHLILQNNNSVVSSDISRTTKVSISKEELSLNVGSSTQLTAKAFFTDGTSTQEIYWLSSDPSVASCAYDDKGLCTVTGISPGEVSIYAVANDSGIIAECKLTIVAVNPFNDVKESDYYFTPVLWAVEHGITTGTGKGKFSPEDACTRGQIVTFLWRAAGSPKPKTASNPFSDVSKQAYYYDAVLWAVENGITNGTGKGKFSPEDTCTRGQIVTFLWRAQGEPTPTFSANPFNDVSSSAYYYKAVLWAVENGITNGMGKGKFAPDDNCTRGQIVTFLYRAIA